MLCFTWRQIDRNTKSFIQPNNKHHPTDLLSILLLHEYCAPPPLLGLFCFTKFVLLQYTWIPYLTISWTHWDSSVLRAEVITRTSSAPWPQGTHHDISYASLRKASVKAKGNIYRTILTSNLNSYVYTLWKTISSVPMLRQPGYDLKCIVWAVLF